jgi:MFS transporter, SP family, sugar:H+ symporter
MWGAGMGRAMADYTSSTGWLVPVGVQFIPAIILAVGIPFTVGKNVPRSQQLKTSTLIGNLEESPRWLVTRRTKEEALKSLNKVRPKRLVDDGYTLAEIEAIDEAVEASDARNQGSWLDLFRGTHLRRTIIASLLFWVCVEEIPIDHSKLDLILTQFQQSTGTQFVNSYAPTFFQDIGYGSSSFTYSFLAQLGGFVGALFSCLLADKIGRRPLLISGVALGAFFNFLIAGLGTKDNPTAAEANAVVASLILLTTCCKYSSNVMAYLITAEIGGVRMRKKSKLTYCL